MEERGDHPAYAGQSFQSDSDTVESDAGDDGNASIEDNISDNGSDQVSDDKNPASETEEESVPDTEMQDEEAAEESSDMASPAGAVVDRTITRRPFGGAIYVRMMLKQARIWYPD